VRVFPDTNVLASAVTTRGLCADVLREVLSSHDLIISKPLLKELRDVLKKKFGVPASLVSEFINMLQQDTTLADHSGLPDVKIKDKDDLIILATALSGDTELFITGDKELLLLKKIEKMGIVSPRSFWEKLKAS
jgi:putative PIN family toxin of toxin-antitoxin system